MTPTDEPLLLPEVLTSSPGGLWQNGKRGDALLGQGSEARSVWHPQLGQRLPFEVTGQGLGPVELLMSLCGRD